MQVSIDTTKWYDRIWASFIFFTRLPFWRLHQPPKEAYQTVVEHWPLVGWLTGAVMGAVIYFGCYLFSYEIAILLAILTRLLMTGALHEDGLADFMDGFGGGGKDRQRILDIMKDSHIGTYGVIGLIVYFLLLFFALHTLSPLHAAPAIILSIANTQSMFGVAMGDPYAKMLSAQLIQMMPYARNEETAKNKVVYRKFNMGAGISLAIQGLLPVAVYIYIMYASIDWQWLLFAPAIVMYFLYMLIWNRLRGYTGDCCGALCLIIELTTLLVVSMNRLF